MGARSTAFAVPPRSSWAVTLFSASWGNIEAFKWIGFLAMLVEHTASALGGPHGGWAFQVGRFAFPLFLYGFVLAVAGQNRDTAERAAFRLLPFALVAQCGVMLVRGETPLNVLFQFLALAAYLAADARSDWERYFVKACAVFVAALSEFWLPGFVLGLALVRSFERRGASWPCVAAAAGVAVCWFEGSAMALAAPLVVLLVMWRDWRMARWRLWFPAAYAAQWPILLLLQKAVGHG